MGAYLGITLAGFLLATVHTVGLQQHFAPRPSTPIDPISAIFDAFKTYPVVAVGEGSPGSEQHAALRLALVRDPRFVTTVTDVVVEFGNVRHQAVMDRFIRGEAVAEDALARVWQDTTSTSFDFDLPVYEAFFRAVRGVNAGRPPARQVRVLLGNPPVNWDEVRTAADIRQWEDQSDQHPVDVIRREVLVKERRALVLYGNMHLQRRNERTNYETADTLVGLLESDGFTKAFTIWTAGRTEIDLGILHPDAPTWTVPSLTMLRGSRLGALDFSSFFVSVGRMTFADGTPRAIRRDERRPLRMEDQFDAVLYLGRAAATRFARLPQALCADSGYMNMRRARMALAPRNEREAARFRDACATR